MDRLPLETIQGVFSELKPCDIANLRLVCRSLSIAGLPYLVREYDLIFQSQSFRKLMEISDDPVLRHYVKTLSYEADTLQEFIKLPMKEQYLAACNPKMRAASRSTYNLPPGISQRERRAKTREIHGSSRLIYTFKEFEDAFDQYREYLEDQQNLYAKDYGMVYLQHAFSRLPNLNHVVLSTERCLLSESATMKRGFQKGRLIPYGHVYWEDPLGVSQLKSVLTAAEASGLKLDCLEAGWIHWCFLEAEPSCSFTISPEVDPTTVSCHEIFTKMLAAVQSLTAIHLHIAGCSDGYFKRIDRYLQAEGRLRAFITAAPNLEHLEVNFQPEVPTPLVDLSDIVGDFSWPNLQFISFGFITVYEDFLMEFLTDHAKTLKGIVLEDIQLRADGQWPRLLQSMRKTLQLKHATIQGCLTDEDGETWVLEDSFALKDRTEFMKSAIEEYLVAGGEGPLLEMDTLTHLEKYRITIPDDESDDSGSDSSYVP